MKSYTFNVRGYYIYLEGPHKYKGAELVVALHYVHTYVVVLSTSFVSFLFFLLMHNYSHVTHLAKGQIFELSILACCEEKDIHNTVICDI